MNKIVEDYKSGLSLKKVAELNNCSIGSVRHSLKKHGIPTRDKGGKTVGRKVINVPPTRFDSKNPKPIDRPSNKIVQRKEYPLRDELLKYATTACEKCGGIASIDGRYAIVDTKIVNVEVK